MKNADFTPSKVGPRVGSTTWWRLPALLLLLLGLAAVALGSLVWARVPAPPAGPQEEAVFPLPERYSGSYADDWGVPRAQDRHEGTDLFVPEGTPIRSITAGTVVLTRGSKENGWNELGGYTVMVEAAYDAGPIRRGDLLY